MLLVCVRNSDGVVEKVLEGGQIPAVHLAAEPAYWAQFAYVPWDESVNPTAPEPGDSSVTPTTFVKSPDRLAREAESAADPALRQSLIDALEALERSTGTLSDAQVASSIRDLAAMVREIAGRVFR